MIAYVDTSACAKLIFHTEPHAQKLRQTLMEFDAREQALVSSQLLETELRRIVVRRGAPQTAATEILSRISLILPDRDFFHQAGLLPGSRLRSLDALHLVTAIHAGADVVLSYDHRLLDAARDAGLLGLAPT